MKTENYPEKTCEIGKLVMQDRMVQKVLAGLKTQQRRNGLYAYPGETFELAGEQFIVSAVRQQTLGDMTEQDAHAEGFDDLQQYHEIIMRMHPGMTWNPAHPVWLHEFHKVS